VGVKLKPALLDFLMGISRVKSIYLVVRVWGLDGGYISSNRGDGLPGTDHQCDLTA
jgi:hypothetical protein